MHASPPRNIFLINFRLIFNLFFLNHTLFKITISSNNLLVFLITVLLLNPYFSFHYFLFGFSFNQRFFLFVIMFSLIQCFFSLCQPRSWWVKLFFLHHSFHFLVNALFFNQRVVLYATKFIFVEHVFLEIFF